MHCPEAVSAMRTAAMVLVACSMFACTPPAAVPPLEPGDFLLGGMPPDADSVEIRMSFGDPDSLVVSQNPYDAFTPVTSWYYDGFTVVFSGDASPSSYLITGGDEATPRGVRVGDPATRVLQLYGEPTYRYDPVWTYVDPADPDATYVIEFLIEEDVVTRIHLGRVE